MPMAIRAVDTRTNTRATDPRVRVAGDDQRQAGAEQADQDAAAHHPRGWAMALSQSPACSAWSRPSTTAKTTKEEGAADRREQQGARGDLLLGAVLLGGEQHDRRGRGHGDGGRRCAPAGGETDGQQREDEDGEEGQRRFGMPRLPAARGWRSASAGRGGGPVSISSRPRAVSASGLASAMVSRSSQPRAPGPLMAPAST